jgi:hypothetical protein
VSACSHGVRRQAVSHLESTGLPRSARVTFCASSHVRTSTATTMGPCHARASSGSRRTNTSESHCVASVTCRWSGNLLLAVSGARRSLVSAPRAHARRTTVGGLAWRTLPTPAVPSERRAAVAEPEWKSTCRRIAMAGCSRCGTCTSRVVLAAARRFRAHSAETPP